MADIKAVIIVLKGSLKEEALSQLRDKYVQFDHYAAGETGVEKLDKAVVLNSGDLNALEEAAALHPVVIHADAAHLAATVQAVTDVRNRHTLIVVIADDGVCFIGAGITRERTSSERAVNAADIVPTICYLTGIPVPADNTGALLYQAMKDVNAPYTQIASLKASVEALDYTLERSQRTAWDKHDCA